MGMRPSHYEGDINVDEDQGDDARGGSEHFGGSRLMRLMRRGRRNLGQELKLLMPG